MEKPSRKNVILFDLDGTLINPHGTLTRCARLALAHVGVSVGAEEDLSFFIGPPLRETFKEAYGLAPEQVERAVAEFDAHLVGEAGMAGTHVYAGIEPMLASLKAGGRMLLIATSKPTVFALEILTHFGLAPYFDGIYGSELDGSRTKKAEVIAHALDRSGIADISGAVMVGDREHDIIGARAHGMDSIGVAYGFGTRAELMAAGAGRVVETVEALGALLAGE